MQLDAGTVIDDRYEVLGRIGSGAVAVVHLVRHVQLGSLHALKVLMVPTRFVQTRLLQEGRFQGSLRDRNIVVVTDVVDVDGAPGLVMEYVRGPSLERLMQHAHLDLGEARALGAGILLGVRAVHASGLVHRDLKPANVLIDADDTSLIPKIADFGLAKFTHGDGDGPTATRAGATLGTPAYMPPEQIRDARSVDERADVFALGAVLYELLTSRRAFPGDDLLDLYARIGEGRYVPVRALAPEVPPEVEAIVDAALQVDRDARIGSVSELLDRWTDGKGEAAAEFDWPSRLVSLAQGLAPASTDWASSSTSGLSAATFDLRAAHPTDEGELPPSSAPTVPHAGDTLGDLAADPPVQAIAVSETTIQPVEPPRALHPRVRPFRRRIAVSAAALGALGATVLLCGGGAGGLGVAIAAGWLQWGPEAPTAPVEGVVRPLYVAGDPPRLPLPAGQTELHKAAWAALRDGRPSDAIGPLRAILAGGTPRDDGAVQLLLATALLQTGDSEGYRRLGSAAQAAGVRRGPLASLARLASTAVAGKLDPREVDRHFAAWRDDALARMLLASIDGVDGDLRRKLASELTDLDPDRAAGWALQAELAVQRGDLREADRVLRTASPRIAAALPAGAPTPPRIQLARARYLLAAGEPAAARQVAEGLGPPEEGLPGQVEVLAGALRSLQELALLDGVAAEVDDDDVRFVAFARGRGEAAFGLGEVVEAMSWFQVGFERASMVGRFDDAVDLARLVQAGAVLLGRPEDLEVAVHLAEEATAIVGLPGALHDRITPRILLMNGLLAIDHGDAAKVERSIRQLEGIDGGERQAALLRAASMARQGVPLPLVDPPQTACVVRSLDARWRAEASGAPDPALYAPLAADDGPCVAYGTDRYVRADAAVHLALAAAAAGDQEATRTYLAAVDRWAPDRPLGTPLYDDAAVAAESLVDLSD